MPEYYLRSLGVQNIFTSVHLTNKTIAGAIGISTDLSIPFVNVQGPSAIGLVFVNRNYLNYFTDSEWSFIMAHESAHIFHNHVLSSAFWTITERLAKGNRNQNYVLVNSIKALLAMLSPDRLPPVASELRNNEYAADETALAVTGDIVAAERTLNKLSGGNLESPFHTWELFDVPLPAMTLRMRIKELRKRYQCTSRLVLDQQSLNRMSNTKSERLFT